MKATRQLHDVGQSLWLDNITRGILDDGTLAAYIRDLSVTGLTSNPSIFDNAISSGVAGEVVECFALDLAEHALLGGDTHAVPSFST